MGRSYTSKQMIEKLVSFDTTSCNSNLEIVNFIENYLLEWGVVSKKDPNYNNDKSNIYALIGPNCSGGVVLSGHTDVVPADHSQWDTDPFSVVERDGKLFGRGTADMKSFIAIALALVPEMLKANLNRPIILAFSYDEELGCIGAPSMIAQIVKNYPTPHAVIVGEPTSMEIANGHKGGTCIETTVFGCEAHSSEVEQGVSAVLIAAELITFINRMMIECYDKRDVNSTFSPCYTTLSCGTISGGTAQNILAGKCTFNWGVRCLPGEDPFHYINKFKDKCHDLLNDMRHISKDCNIISNVFSDVPPLEPETNGAAETLMTHLLLKNITRSISYGSEAGQFQKAGLSTVMCGPGSILQAHQPNEFIELSQVAECEKALLKLIRFQS